MLRFNLLFKPMLYFLLFCSTANIERLHRLVKINEIDETPLKILCNELGTYKFYKRTNNTPMRRIHHHYYFSIQALLNHKEAIEHTVNKKKYVIKPFHSIMMEDGDDKTCLGKYRRSILRDGIYTQEFTCGSVCDLRNEITISSKVHYKGCGEPIKVTSFIEGKLCRFDFNVAGDILTRNINVNQSIEYSFLKKESIKKEANKEEMNSGEKTGEHGNMKCMEKEIVKSGDEKKDL